MTPRIYKQIQQNGRIQINTQKSILLLNKKNEPTEKENNPIHHSFKRIKYFGNNLTKEVKTCAIKNILL